MVLFSERVVRLYPPVKVIGKSFVNAKRTVVPNQSMSLREIVKRFVRRESLPLSKEGTFEDRYGDLEKLSKEDITVQMDRVEQIRADLLAMKKRIDDQEISRRKAHSDAVVKQKAVEDFMAQSTLPPTPPAKAASA